MPITAENVAGIFTYHAPDEGQRVAYDALRAGALHLARIILEVTPPCADREAALRHLREAVATANSAIALKGAV